MIRQMRHLLNLLRFSILTLFLIATGCQSGPPPVAGTCPEWVKSNPQDETYFYAVGISGPTPRVADAWAQAIERARAELGRTVISHITSKGKIISSSSGEYIEEIVRILSDTELNYTEVIERWPDRSGVYGPPDHFYVLVRMEKRRAESVLGMIKQ